MTRPRLIREMTETDLRERVAELHKSLFNLRTRAVTKDLDNISTIRTERRELARVLTILRQRGIKL